MAHAAATPQFPRKPNEPEGDPRPETQNLPVARNLPVPVVASVKLSSKDATSPLRTSASDFFYDAAAKTVDACASLVESSVEMKREVGRRVGQFKNERPLQFIGVIAGSAFAFGLMVRVWRSRQ